MMIRKLSNGTTRLAYILAASHSGSTLLAMLLGAHPEVVTVGELKVTSLGNVDRYRCSCRKKIQECPFWEAVTREMGRRGVNFDVSRPGTDIRSGASPFVLRLLKPLHRGLLLEIFRDGALHFSAAWRNQLPIIQRTNSSLMDCILSLTNKNIIVDSSKIGIRLKYLRRNRALDIKIIRLVRDGRAVSLTYLDPARFADAENPVFRGGGLGGERSSEKLSIEQAAREWKRSNEEAEALLRGVERTKWQVVRYEDLCREPENTLKEIFAFIGVDPEKINLDFRSVEHHIIGNGMRLDGSSSIEIDERWKTNLSPTELDIFDQVAGAKNRALGYM